VAMCNPNWKQGKSQGKNEMNKKRRMGKEKFEKNEKRMETMKKLEKDQKRNGDKKKKKTSHLLIMTFRCERQRCDNNV
jgi:hypothetical protein